MPIPCPIPCIICTPGAPGSRGLQPTDDNPFLNLSSEAPDVNVFIGRRYTPFVPPLGKFFYAVSCVGYCFSSTSQDDADLCATRQNALCNAVNWPGNPIFPQDPRNPIVRPPSSVFPNQRQVATFTCANGSVFTYEIGAGSFFASSTAQANAFALSYARNHAAQKAICLSAIAPTRICFKQPSTCIITVTNSVGAVTYAVVGGFLPDGMVLENEGTTAQITGTPVAAGTFNFTIAVTDSVGGYAEQGYSLEVFGITAESPAPNATIGTPYLFDLTIGGTAQGILNFMVTSGTLPAGLTLNSSTGIISGTPTTAGTSNFTVKVQDFVGGNPRVSCSKDFTLTVAATGCTVFSNFVWPAPVIITSGTGFASGNALAENIIDMTTGNTGTVGAFPNDPQNSQINFLGAFNYTGPAINCCYRIHFTGSAPAVGADPALHGSTFAFGGVYQNGVPIPASGFSQFGNGAPIVIDVPFTLGAAAVPALIQFNIVVQTGYAAGFGVAIPATSAILSATIGFC